MAVVVRIQTTRTCTCSECIERRAVKPDQSLPHRQRSAAMLDRPRPRHDGGIFYVIEQHHPISPKAKVEQYANNITWTFPPWHPAAFVAHLDPVPR